MRVNQQSLSGLRANAVDDAVQDLAPVSPGAWSPSFDGATGWLNSPRLSGTELRGRVVLVDFWTYTCINWLRTLPYLRAWHRAYADRGLTLIGVHSPEFGFERDDHNVRRAVRDMGIEYPVAIDSNHSVWRSFKNQYWPAVYVIDTHGRLQHHKFGEGGYAETELVIQRLLAEAGLADVHDLVAVAADGVESPADWASLRSPENYLGYDRTESFASPGDLQPEQTAAYTVPDRLRLNHWALSGTWSASRDAIVARAPDASITSQFHARDLHLVMGPVTRDTSVRFQVRLDGEPPGEAHGLDVDEQGYGIVGEQRLYQLLRQPGSIVDRQVEIEFAEPGVAAYAFTFG